MHKHSKILFLLFVIFSLIGCVSESPPIDEKFGVNRICPAQDSIKGIDISHHQGIIDWEKISSQDIKFIYIRTGDGIKVVDRNFIKNWTSVKDYNIIKGAYQFFRPTQNPEYQAKLFVEQINFVGGLSDKDLPPVIDIEVSDGATKQQIVDGVKIWLDIVEKETNKRPMIYTGPAFWDQYVNSKEFNSYPLWTAHYTTSKCPWAPTAWNDWRMWQYTGQGQIDGIIPVVDINLYNGNMESLYMFIESNNIIQKTDPSNLEPQDCCHIEDAQSQEPQDTAIDVSELYTPIPAQSFNDFGCGCNQSLSNDKLMVMGFFAVIIIIIFSRYNRK